MVLTVSTTPPAAFFLEIALLVFMIGWAAIEAPDQAERGWPSQAAWCEISLGQRRCCRQGGDDDDRLGERRLVGEGDIEARQHPGRGDRLKAAQGAAGQPHPRLSRGLVDDAEVAPENPAAKAGAERLGGGLLGGEAAGIARSAGRAAAIAAAALGFGEDAVEKTLAKALDRLLDPANVDQIATDAEDHRGQSLPECPSFPQKRESRGRKTVARPGPPLSRGRR